MGPRDAARHYFTAQTFLTRLPAPRWVGFSAEWVPPSVAWFPLVGAVVGAFGAGVFWLMVDQTHPTVAAVAAVLVTVLVTGAIHEDGLADTADGIGGGRDREHSLEIMRDSRVGSYGVVALVLALSLRIALLAALGGGAAPVALVLAHSLARASVLPLMTTLPYLRDQGAGSPFMAPHAPSTLAVFAALTLLIAALFDGLVPLLVAAAVSVAAWGYFRQRLGGITGDGFGAVVVVVEVAVLLTVLIQR
ncbi:MAG: adenosylcobinamide-GDP ribazoletransferase [Pseudomonadota bacterium]